MPKQRLELTATEYAFLVKVKVKGSVAIDIEYKDGTRTVEAAKEAALKLVSPTYPNAIVVQVTESVRTPEKTAWSKTVHDYREPKEKAAQVAETLATEEKSSKKGKGKKQEVPAQVAPVAESVGEPSSLPQE